MTNFAVIENGIVANIIVAEDLTTALAVTGKTCVEYDNTPELQNSAHIGLGYANGVFEQPITPEAITEKTTEEI
jgi:NaMN:DMB phosphoribosyltransferase